MPEDPRLLRVQEGGQYQGSDQQQDEVILLEREGPVVPVWKGEEKKMLLIL